jgi:hypothetical protein
VEALHWLPKRRPRGRASHTPPATPPTASTTATAPARASLLACRRPAAEMLAHLLYSDAFEEALNVALLSVQSPPSKTQARESGGDDDSSSGEEDDAPSGQGPLPTASSTNHTDEVSTKGHASTSSGHPSSSDRDTSNASSSGRPAGALLKKVIWAWRFATRALVLLLPLTESQCCTISGVFWLMRRARCSAPE